MYPIKGVPARALKLQVSFKQENWWNARAVIIPSLERSTIRIVKHIHKNSFMCSGTTFQWRHMSVMASQIIGNLTLCSTKCSGSEQRKRQNHFHVMLSSWRISLANNRNKTTVQHRFDIHGDVINWKLFSYYWPFVRGTTGYGGIPLTKTIDFFLCFHWSAPEQTFEQTMETPMISDAIGLIMTSL